jgi:hypothetical protein
MMEASVILIFALVFFSTSLFKIKTDGDWDGLLLPFVAVQPSSSKAKTAGKSFIPKH